ncbi:hypothetical protein AYI68_g1353 [Smittium mucronatum]|uniref:Reverse transcriptase domain-containing protein n=1 Tax=Smittium mucronatum TaxID=133383 RepID=A0A1R0H5X2_9FUNG|nr:hypothetical protein AYI68_g1353 [Smittium mucronatum]
MEETKEMCNSISQSIYSKISELGFNINDEKSYTSPSHPITHLGIVINTREMALNTPVTKEQEIIEAELMEVDINSEENCYAEPIVL